MPTAICPECDEDVYVDAESEQGDKVTCDECGTKLVIVGLDPIEVDPYDETEDDTLDEDEDAYNYETERY